MAREFVETCARQDEPLYLSYLTLMSYVRMSTHPRIFTHPLTPKEAFDNIEKLATLPHVRLISERDGYLEVYREVTRDKSVRGNLVPDAHLASILKQHGVSILYTNNVNDFRLFGFLDVRNPFNQ